jgi:hypothetical protein
MVEQFFHLGISLLFLKQVVLHDPLVSYLDYVHTYKDTCMQEMAPKHMNEWTKHIQLYINVNIHVDSKHVYFI